MYFPAPRGNLENVIWCGLTKKNIFMDLQKLTQSAIQQLAGEKIYQRGVEYFIDGKVREFDLIASRKKIEAVVEGSYNNDYCVDIDYGKGVFLCDCPFDKGICKHIVAVMLKYFKLYDTKPEQKEKVAKKVDKPKKTVPLSKHLDNLEREELVEIIIGEAKRSKEFNAILQLRFQDANQTVEALKQEITALFPKTRSEMGRFDERRALKKVETLFKPIEQLPYDSQLELYWFATDSCLWLLNELRYTNRYLEEYITDTIDIVVSYLIDCTTPDLRQKVISGMMFYIGNVYQPSLEDDLLLAVIMVVQSVSEIESVIHVLQKLPQNTYYTEQLQTFEKKLKNK